MAKENNFKSTVTEIARLAGVSIGTVDRVLHNRPDVSKETREKVLKIAKKINYEPNLIARSLAKGRDYLFCAIIPFSEGSSPYWELPLIGMKRAADELKHYKVSVRFYFYHQGSTSSFQESLEEAKGVGAAGFIITPDDETVTLDFIEQIYKQEIPIVTIDRHIEKAKYLSTVCQDNRHSGYTAARLIQYITPESSDIIMVTMFDTNTSRLLPDKRCQGFMDFFNERKETKRSVSYFNANPQSDSNLLELHDRLAKDNNIKGIFVPHSRAYYLIKISKIIKQNQIAVIGYDIIKPNIEGLNKDIIRFLIGQRPEEQGYRAVMTLFGHLIKGETVDMLQYVPIDIFTKDNIML